MFVDKTGTVDNLNDELHNPLCQPSPAFIQLSDKPDVDGWSWRLTRVLHTSLNLYGLNAWANRRLHKGALNVRRT